MQGSDHQDNDNSECELRDLLVPVIVLLHRRRQHGPDVDRPVLRLLRNTVPVLSLHLHEPVHLRRQARGSETEAGQSQRLPENRISRRASSHRRWH